jgi:hypothetical protein
MIAEMRGPLLELANANKVEPSRYYVQMVLQLLLTSEPEGTIFGEVVGLRVSAGDRREQIGR